MVEVAGNVTSQRRPSPNAMRRGALVQSTSAKRYVNEYVAGVRSSTLRPPPFVVPVASRQAHQRRVAVITRYVKRVTLARTPPRKQRMSECCRSRHGVEVLLSREEAGKNKRDNATSMLVSFAWRDMAGEQEVDVR